MTGVGINYWWSLVWHFSLADVMGEPILLVTSPLLTSSFQQMLTVTRCCNLQLAPPVLLFNGCLVLGSILEDELCISYSKCINGMSRTIKAYVNKEGTTPAGTQEKRIQFFK